MNEVINNTVNNTVGGDTMSAFVTALTGSSGVTSSALWNLVTEVAPIVVIGFTVGFGLFILRRALRGAQKGKAKV